MTYRLSRASGMSLKINHYTIILHLTFKYPEKCKTALALR